MSGALTHSPGRIMSKLLIALGYGTTPSDAGSWPIWYSGIGDQPDNAIQLTDQQGRDHGRAMKGGERQEHHGFQVLVRATDPDVGHAKARVIAVAMDEIIYQNSVGVSTSTYLVSSISRTSEVLSLGEEKPTSRRVLFTVNAIAAIRQVS